MADIYTLLSKHFLNETSESEEREITLFKKDNLIEYNILKEVWQRDDIKVNNFDTKKAWIVMQAKVSSQKKIKIKVIPPYQRLRRMAAVAVILILGAFSIFYFVDNFEKRQIVFIKVNTGDIVKEVLFGDGSKVWLNSGSSISFPKKFGPAERTVSMTGEAFFEVIKMPNRKFIVNTSNSSTLVLGTSFNINSGEKKTEVTVATGEVYVSDADDVNKVKIIPGYTASVRGKKVEKFKTKSLNYMSWKTGSFTFDNTAIKQVVKDLNTYYKKQIIIAEGTKFDCKLTANFKDIKLDEIIKIMQLACDLNVSTKGDNYVIKKKVAQQVN